MLIHSVYFWLKDELSPGEVEEFRAGLEKLKEIDLARDVQVGTPSATAPRPVLDSSYDIGLVVLLEDVAAHDAYQAHPIHQEFLEKFASYWKKVTVYDVG
ncbi:MAG: Dabb family protein [Candidatus Hydrogenedentes bacterium]|nr:Dabb family protein [Candidatus Hydrogenedentota bacterium]